MTDHPQRTLPVRFTYPVEIHDRTPFLKGTMDGKPCTLLFDSGAQEITLNAGRLEKEGLTKGGGSKGITGEATSYFFQVEEMAFGDWRFEKVNAMAMDLMHLEKEFGIEIQGVIGFRQLIHYEWMVDYNKCELHLWERLSKSDLTFKERIRTKYHHHLPAFDLQIAGQTFRFLLDTGASVLVFDKTKKDLVMDEVTGLYTEPMASSSPIEMDVAKGTLSGFQIGKLNFGPSEINFMDLSITQQSLGDFDGIIGYYALSKYNAIVSWSYRSIWFLED